METSQELCARKNILHAPYDSHLTVHLPRFHSHHPPSGFAHFLLPAWVVFVFFSILSFKVEFKCPTFVISSHKILKFTFILSLSNSLLVIYPIEMKTHIHKKTCVRICVIALFLRAKSCKHPNIHKKILSTSKQIVVYS